MELPVVAHPVITRTVNTANNTNAFFMSSPHHVRVKGVIPTSGNTTDSIYCLAIFIAVLINVPIKLI